VRGTAQTELVGSIRKAAAACTVTPTVVRRWIARGWFPQPPWMLRQMGDVRDLNDTDEHWAAALQAALMASRRDELKHWHEWRMRPGLGWRVSGRPMHPDGQMRAGRAGVVVAATGGEIVESETSLV
jgi:hypothetical protein